MKKQSFDKMLDELVDAVQDYSYSRCSGAPQSDEMDRYRLARKAIKDYVAELKEFTKR